MRLAAFETLKQQVERHHLGDRGGVAQAVLVDAIKRAAAVRVDDDRREDGGIDDCGEWMPEELRRGAREPPVMGVSVAMGVAVMARFGRRSG